MWRFDLPRNDARATEEAEGCRKSNAEGHGASEANDQGTSEAEDHSTSEADACEAATRARAVEGEGVREGDLATAP